MIHVGDCLAIMRTLPAGTVQTCVTSPPYFGLRDYGVEGQHGLEASPDCLGWATGQPCGECFICVQVAVFREVRRLLRDDGTCWINLGDSYAGSGRGGAAGSKSTLDGSGEHQDLARAARNVSDSQRKHSPEPKGGRVPSSSGLNASSKRHQGVNGGTWAPAPKGWKQKDLLLMPARLALALQADGWYLRQDIIWAKPNPMPESVRDRCTKAHEYLFLLAKSERYYYDQAAVREPCSPNTHARMAQGAKAKEAGGRGNVPSGWDTREGRGHRDLTGRYPVSNGVGWGYDKGEPRATRKLAEGRDAKNNSSFDAAMAVMPSDRNKRSVWTVPTEAFSEAHFATFPQALIEPCILAGSRPGDLVLDPYLGAGTTAVVAQRLGRRWTGCELNPEYAAIAERRVYGQPMGLPLAVPA